jgi:hypothetical protein
MSIGSSATIDQEFFDDTTNKKLEVKNQKDPFDFYIKRDPKSLKLDPFTKINPTALNQTIAFLYPFF